MAKSKSNRRSNMMRTMSGVAVAAATAAMSISPQVGTVKQVNEITVNQQQKATPTETKTVNRITQHNVSGSGLDYVFVGGSGLSPKEYGIRYGRGNRKGKTNFLRLSHNHKVKKRVA